MWKQADAGFTRVPAPPPSDTAVYAINFTRCISC